MKILSIHSYEGISGGEKISFLIYEFLKKYFDFYFYLPSKPKFEKDIKLYYPKSKGLINNIFTLAKILKKEDFDLIHIHGLRAGFIFKLSCFLCFKKNKKVIYTLHGIHFLNKTFPLNFIYCLLEILTNRIFVDALVCVSKEDFEISFKYRLHNKNKIFLIENGIDESEFQKDFNSEELKKEFNLKDEKIVLSIGRFHHQKDFATLIKAMSYLNDKLKLFLVGDGSQRDQLLELTKKLNLENKVVFTGYRNDVWKFYKICDLFVLSSRWEGLPLVLLEAMANKKPIIGSNVRGIRELIIDGYNGYLFKLVDVIDLVNKIKIIINDLGKIKEMCENSYKLFSQRYKAEIMAEKYYHLYLNLINENSSSK